MDTYSDIRPSTDTSVLEAINELFDVLLEERTSHDETCAQLMQTIPAGSRAHELASRWWICGACGYVGQLGKVLYESPTARLGCSNCGTMERLTMLDTDRLETWLAN